MNATDFIKTTLNRSDQLYRIIYAFNFSLVRYIHPSFLKELGTDGPAIKFLENSDRMRYVASNYLLNYFNLAGKEVLDFSDPRSRLALIDGPTLEKLIFRAGVVIYSTRVNQLIKKEDVAKAKAALGEEMFFYANKRAALVYALVPDYPWDLSSITKEHIFEAGKKCLEICLSGEPAGLTERLRLKFDASLKWNFDEPGTAIHKQKAWIFLKRLLFKEIEPRWQACFT